MAPILIDLHQMVDMALATPEIGVVNASVLHALLHCLVHHLAIPSYRVEFHGADHKLMEQMIAAIPAVSPVSIAEFSVADPTKADVRTPVARPVDRNAADVKTILAINVLDCIPGGGSKPPPGLPLVPMQVLSVSEWYALQNRSVHDGVAGALPTNESLLDVIGDANDHGETGTLIRMNRLLNLTKRVDAVEIGIRKLAELLSMFTKELKPCPCNASSGSEDESDYESEDDSVHPSDKFQAETDYAGGPFAERPCITEEEAAEGIKNLKTPSSCRPCAPCTPTKGLTPLSSAMVSANPSSTRPSSGGSVSGPANASSAFTTPGGSTVVTANPSESGAITPTAVCHPCIKRPTPRTSASGFDSRAVSIITDECDACADRTSAPSKKRRPKPKTDDCAHCSGELIANKGSSKGTGPKGSESKTSSKSKVRGSTGLTEEQNQTLFRTLCEHSNQLILVEQALSSVDLVLVRHTNDIADLYALCERNRAAIELRLDNAEISFTALIHAVQDELNEQFMKEHNLFVQTMIEVQAMLDAKVDKLCIPAIKQYLVDRLHEFADVLEEFRREFGLVPDACATTVRLLRNVDCLSCKKNATQKNREQPPYMPRMAEAPPGRVISGGPPREELRYCGASHTTTTADERFLVHGHFVTQYGDAGPNVQANMERGTDGNMYRTRIGCPCGPNVPELPR